MSHTTTSLPAFMRRMTPDKYKAMSKADQRAYDRKARAWMAKLDASIDRRNAENHKKLALGIAELVQLDPAVEWEIVHNYLQLEEKYLVSKGFLDENPRVVDSMVNYDAARAAESRKTGKPKRATKTTQEG
jgi:hypothetical protein